MVSAGHVGGTRGSSIVSSAADLLWMSVGINETPVLALNYISLLMWRVLLIVKYVLTMLNIGLTKNNAK